MSLFDNTLVLGALLKRAANAPPLTLSTSGGCDRLCFIVRNPNNNKSGCHVDSACLPCLHQMDE